MYNSAYHCRPRFSPRAIRKRGFTLLELMLVLSIIVIMGAIASPMLGNLLERQKLVAAVETVRLEWDEARLQAMKTGQAQVFTCELGTGSYTIKPLVLQADVTNAGEGANLATSGGLVEMENFGRGNVAVAADPEESASKSLDEKIVFESCRVVSDMRSFVTAQDSQSSGLGDVNTQTVAQSIIFYADGSTSTAEVRIQNARGDLRAVQLRGLTGHSRIYELANAQAQEQGS